MKKYYQNLNRRASFTALFLMLILSAAKQKVYANLGDQYISTQNGKGYFKLKGAPMKVSETDFPGVIRAAKDLQNDL
ncbi:MAG: hypothetical protein EOP42_28820, partial [Sphingobacteriaceae bacterium]